MQARAVVQVFTFYWTSFSVLVLHYVDVYLWYTYLWSVPILKAMIVCLVVMKLWYETMVISVVFLLKVPTPMLCTVEWGPRHAFVHFVLGWASTMSTRRQRNNTHVSQLRKFFFDTQIRTQVLRTGSLWRYLLDHWTTTKCHGILFLQTTLVFYMTMMWICQLWHNVLTLSSECTSLTARVQPRELTSRAQFCVKS